MKRNKKVREDTRPKYPSIFGTDNFGDEIF
jgi:hypothetical protein